MAVPGLFRRQSVPIRRLRVHQRTMAPGPGDGPACQKGPRHRPGRQRPRREAGKKREVPMRQREEVQTVLRTLNLDP